MRLDGNNISTILLSSSDRRAFLSQIQILDIPGCFYTYIPLNNQAFLEKHWLSCA